MAIKVLFTGSTAKHIDGEAYKRARIKRIADANTIVNAIKDAGYDIEQRRVKWGDDISQYDISIVAVGNLKSMNFRHMIEALYAIHYSKKVILLHEDWKINETWYTYERMNRDDGYLEKRNAQKLKDGVTPLYFSTDHPEFDNSIIREELQNILDGKYPVLVSKYEWGNRQIVADVIGVELDKLYNYDLTPYVIEESNLKEIDSPPSDREIKYMLASLVDHSSWVRGLKLYHPVDYYGAKTIKEAIILEDEEAVFEKSKEYWGLLCPKYPHAGSGWFRSRYLYSAFNLNVLIMDRRDSEALGLEHFKKIEPYHDDSDLIDIAKEQREAIFKHITTKEFFKNNLINMITKEMERQK